MITKKLQRIAAALLAFASFACATPAGASHLSYPPAPLVKAAINPFSNKVYFVNEFSDSVTVFNAAAGTTTTIPVGPRPQFIVLNPATNRVYVNNANNATVTVIDGATDTNITPTPLPVGSHGPMAVNPLTNTIYIVRQTGLGTDEVTYFNGNTNTWYTIATESFQPIALTVNPLTDTLYVAHYGTGDVRIISAANNDNAHPATTSLGMWSHPFAIAANPVTNRIYVLTQDSRGPIGVIDGGTRTATFPPVAAGHASGPKGLAVNPATNRIYAAFDNEVVVIDGSTNAYTYLPVATGSGPVAVGINPITNKIYVTANNGTLTIIDGDNNAITTTGITTGANSIAVNPLTNRVYVAGDGTSVVAGGAADTVHVVPLTTSISALPGNSSTDGSASFTFTASSAFAPNAMRVRKVYYQLDSTMGAWKEASGSGPFSASFSGLATGAHTLYAVAADGQDAPSSVGPQSAPLVGNVASYAFTVGGSKVTPSVSLMSSANPSASGQAVTFTASVSGSAGAATGTIEFRDGGVALAGCGAVALSGGAAACTTTALTAGSHSITAGYSGNTVYSPAISGAVSQSVNGALVTPSVALTSSLNPSNAGASVTFGATVSGNGGTPTGTVEFRDGGVTIPGCSAVALSSGAASCTTASLATGSHAITARYSGNSAYNPAASAALTQTVNGTKVTPTIGLTTSADPAALGQMITFTATITGTAGTATGTVAFRDGTAAITGCEAVVLSGGKALCSTSSLPQGNHSITAAYSGSAAYNAVTSKALKQNVKPKG